MEPVNDQQRTITAIALLALSVVIVVIAIRGVSSSVRLFTKGDLSDEPLVVDQIEVANEKLRRQDTDGDGLNDYDELNLYNSSPYLVDSDSDGVDDKTEVDAGKDPNCPGGQDCYGAVVEGGNPYSENSEQAPVLLLPPDTANALKELLPQNPTANDIRELLRSQGASESDVNEISDEELLENYSKSYNAL